jgi:hypothetical protein
LVFTTTILRTYLHIKKLYLKEINKLFYIRASIFKFRNTRETTIYINCIKEKKKGEEEEELTRKTKYEGCIFEIID